MLLNNLPLNRRRRNHSPQGGGGDRGHRGNRPRRCRQPCRVNRFGGSFEGNLDNLSLVADIRAALPILNNCCFTQLSQRLTTLPWVVVVKEVCLFAIGKDEINMVSN